jgi:hypothetical protein
MTRLPYPYTAFKYGLRAPQILEEPMSRVLRYASLVSLCVLAAFAAGCSKKSSTRPPIEITQEDADDLVQQVGMMIGSDNGGWFVDLESTIASMPLSEPMIVPAGMTRVTRDTVVYRAGVNYLISYLYSDTTADSISQYNPAVHSVDGESSASGTMMTALVDTLDFFHTSSFVGTGFAAGSDTAVFEADGYDSTFATFTPKYRTGTRYYATFVFTEYDEVRLLRSGNPYPLSGSVLIDVFAERLRSANPADLQLILEATVTITFDGTQRALVGITANLDDPTPQRRYRVDLRTGEMERL